MNFLTEQEVQELLKISERQTKSLFQAEGFPGVRIGKSYRVEESRLLSYLDTAGEIKLEYNNR